MFSPISGLVLVTGANIVLYSTVPVTLQHCENVCLLIPTKLQDEVWMPSRLNATQSNNLLVYARGLGHAAVYYLQSTSSDM